MGGSRLASTDQAANLLLVCGTGTTECHGEIEGNPSQAIGRGFRVRTGADPTLIPYMDHTGQEWHLTNEGTKEQP